MPDLIYLMDKNQQFAFYFQESEKAINALSEILGSKIDDLDFQKALGKMLGYPEDSSTQVIENELTAHEMVERLRYYSFDLPGILDTIVFSQSILPAGTITAVNEKDIKNNGEIWVIHKNDADPFPSNPHAHNKGTGYKMHLGTGELFKKRKSIGEKVSRKDLLAIRDKVKNTPLPSLEV
jgi:hypothetical protein